MRKYNNLLSIPIVEAGSNRVAGSFCSTTDALTRDELEILEKLRTLQKEARPLKKQIKTATPEKQEPLRVRLEELRVQGKYWQELRKQATHDKNIALGHTILPIDKLK